MAEVRSLGGSVKGADDFHDYNCSNCLTSKNIYTEAIFFCPKCNKYTCKPCNVCDHDVIGRQNADKWGQPTTRAQFDPCPKHSGNLLLLYCRRDDVVCCPVCSQSEHKSCGDSIYIPLVVNAKENKAGLLKVKKDLGELHLKADKASKETTTKLTGLDQTEQRLVTCVKEFRARVNALQDNMEKKCFVEIAKYSALFKDRYNSELDICDTIKTEVKDLQNKLATTLTDEFLLFSRIKQGNEQIHDKTFLLSDKSRSEIFDEAVFKPFTEIENALKCLQGLGKMFTDSLVDKPITQWSQNIEQRYCPNSHSDTSNKIYRIVDRTNFNVKTKQDKYKCRIEGMCMMPSGDLILADGSNRSLKKVSTEYEVTSRCSLTHEPWDVCATEPDNVAVALLGQTVQLVAVSGNMSCTSSFSTDHACLSLAYSNKCLHIISGTGGNAVYVYNLAGTQLRVITQDQHGNQLFSDTHFITTSRDGERLHVSDKHGLVTIGTMGYFLSRSALGELEGGLFAVCADRDGSFFVGGNNSHKVLQVGGEDYMILSEILSESDGIKVRALCFDGVRCNILISSSQSNTVHVLHLQWHLNIKL